MGRQGSRDIPILNPVSGIGCFKSSVEGLMKPYVGESFIRESGSEGGIGSGFIDGVKVCCRERERQSFGW